MTFDQLLLAAVEQRLLRPLDVQFALMVAQNDPPAVKLAAALLSRDAGEGHVCLPLSRLSGDEALSGKAGEIRDRLLADAGAPEDWPAGTMQIIGIGGEESVKIGTVTEIPIR